MGGTGVGVALAAGTGVRVGAAVGEGVRVRVAVAVGLAGARAVGQPKRFTGVFGGVPGQKSQPWQNSLKRKRSQTPSPSASTWPRAQPKRSTGAPAGVPGQRSQPRQSRRREKPSHTPSLSASPGARSGAVAGRGTASPPAAAPALELEARTAIAQRRMASRLPSRVGTKE